jgi:hypothetical protein
MKAPIFRAKDKDSDEWVEGFYVQFPAQRDVDECAMVHAIMVVVPDENSLSPDSEINGINKELIDMAKNFTVNGESGYQLKQLNTLVYCTIDISTLEKVRDVEIGQRIYYNDMYIQELKPKGIFKCLTKMLKFFL